MHTLQIMVKAKDELGGRLTDNGGIRKVLDENEKRKLSSGYERAKKILRNAGAKGIFKTGYLAAHPGGTVNVGKLVDSDLKTEYENLYVCDCSIIFFHDSTFKPMQRAALRISIVSLYLTAVAALCLFPY